MDSEHSIRKRQDYLSKWSVAPVNFSPERHEKQCPIHFSTGFPETFCSQITLTSSPGKLSGTGRNNFG